MVTKSHPHLFLSSAFSVSFSYLFQHIFQFIETALMERLKLQSILMLSKAFLCGESDQTTFAIPLIELNANSFTKRISIFNCVPIPILSFRQARSPPSLASATIPLVFSWDCNGIVQRKFNLNPRMLPSFQQRRYLLPILICRHLPPSNRCKKLYRSLPNWQENSTKKN